MSILGNAIVELSKMADEAKLPIESMVKAITVYEKRQSTLHSERASTSETRENIAKVFEELNGEITAETSLKDLLARAGVPRNQGNMAFARHTQKKLLLAYQSAASAKRSGKGN